jgi:hypothetical protein
MLQISDSRYGDPLRRFLTVRDWEASRDGDNELTEIVRFYNACYWFLTFIRLVRREEGEDPGLERQMLKMLEAAPPETDWSVLQEIYDRVGREVVGHSSSESH